MANDFKIEKFVKDLNKRMKKEMPRIKKEIEIYEKKLAAGKTTQNPTPAPQFND